MRFEDQLKRIDALDARLRAFAIVDRAPAPQRRARWPAGPLP